MSKKGNVYRKRDYERRKGDYERVREYERGRLRARRREYREDFRQRNAKEREVMNGGYRSTCSRSDSGSSGDGGDGLRRFKVAFQAVDREPREPCKDGSDAKTKKAKFSPIVWDRDYREVSGSIKSRSFVDTTSCSPSPEDGEIYLEASPCNVDLRCDLPREDQLVENIGKGGVDQDDYVPSRSLMSSRWANDAGSPAGEITDTSADAKLGRKSSSELSEIREPSRSISPEVGEVKREGSEGDIYHDNDDGNNDSMEVDDSVIPSETELKEDDPGTPQRTQAPKKRANMLQGCRGVDEFERLNKIGEGTYGIVFRARDKKTGEIVALKKVKMMNDGEGFPLTSLREINILLSFHHPSIVDLKEVVMGSDLDSIFMVMEYVEHDLKALMDTMKHPFSQSEVKCLMLQLLEGVKCLHDNWVLHRDLKTSNLLFNNRGELKICDFGLARKYGNPLRPYTQMVVTLWYRAPELLLGAKEYSTAIDIWSVGCIMAELLSKEPLFNGKAELDQLDKIFRILGTPNETIWPGLSKLPRIKANFVKHKYNLLRRKFPAMSFTGPVLSDAGFDLLNKLLTYDPEKRITAEEALNHEWFREVPLPKTKEFMPTFPANHAQDRCMRRVMKRLGPLEEQRIKELQQGESQTGTC